MNVAQLIEKLQILPMEKQVEVFDFVEYLADRFGHSATTAPTEWTDAEFAHLSMTQAMRGMDDEPDLYAESDLKERWS